MIGQFDYRPFAAKPSRDLLYVKLWAATLRINLNSERLTVRLELTVISFPILRQARPDFFRECSKKHVENIKIPSLKPLEFKNEVL